MEEVVIVGSGMGGLTSGAKLSKNGYNVTVIEKHFTAGGYATNFIRKSKTGQKFTFDVSLHGIGDLRKERKFYKALEEIGLFEKINPLRKNETATIILKNGEHIDIPDKFEEYKNLLLDKFPNEKEGIKNLFNYLKDFDNAMETKNNISKYVQDLQEITLYDFISRYIKNEEFIELFSFLWLYYGLPPKKINAYYYCVAWLSYHIGGTYYVEGGAGALSQAFVEIIEENNGKVILKEEVVKVNTENNKVISVETNKGNVFKGDIFILNGCPENILKTLDNVSIVEDYIERLSNRKESISLSQLYIGVDQDPTNLGIEKADLFYSTFENYTEAYECAKNGGYEDTLIGIVNYNILDPKLNEDTGVLCITLGDFEKNWPERGTPQYKAKKQEVTDILLKRMYKLFPKLEGHVVLTELGTPRTMKRYTNNKKGSVYGFAQDIKNGGFNRIPFKTSLDNTYLAGAWTDPGGGYQGTIISGLFCSDIILNTFQKSIEKIEDEQKELMNPDSFIKGMVLQANKKYAKNLSVTYKFDFKEINKQYFIKVENGKIEALPNIQNVDVEIICDYKTWFLIANKKFEGEVALRQGLLKIKGDMTKFMHIPQIFGTHTEQEEEPRKLFKGTAYIPLFLVPWIVYWVLGQFFVTEYIGYFAIIYTVVLGYFAKPKFARQITVLEYSTIFSFAIYNFLIINTEGNTYKWFELILPTTALLSCFGESMMEQYSKWAYPGSIIKTNLFRQINIRITVVWAVVFLLQFIIAKVIFIGNTIGSIAYLLSILAILFSIIYPKKAM